MISLVAFVLAVGSKETALVYPAMWIAWLIFGKGVPLFRSLRLAAPHVLVAALLLGGMVLHPGYRSLLAEAVAAGQLAEAGAVTQAAIESLQDTIAPMQTELDCIKAEHKQAAESLKQALADQRKEADQVRAEVTGLSRQREKHFEELGGALAAAGIDAPALAAERQSVAAAYQSQAALQSQYDALLEESGNMPERTMVKFSALMAIAAFAMAGAT